MNAVAPAPFVNPAFTGVRPVVATAQESEPASPGGRPTDQSSGDRRVEGPAESAVSRNESSRSDARADSAGGLTEEELKQLTELKARDREVRAHEAAHQAAGGQYAGAMSFVYQRGPDGAQYAVGGEVSIDVSPVQGDPQATIEKMRVVRAAAMAPAQPSSQDRAVAAQAMQTMLQAQSELALGEGSRASDTGQAGRGSEENALATGREADQTYRNISAMQGADRNPVTSLFV